MEDLEEILQNQPLVKVIIHWETSETVETTEIITTSKEVATLIKAILELHNGKKPQPNLLRTFGTGTSRVEKITARTLEFKGAYWWTTPGLKFGGPEKGAALWAWGHTEVLWPKKRP